MRWPNSSIGLPLLVAVRLRDARRLDDAPHAHLVLERRLAFLDRAGDRRGAHGMRRARERDVPFAREQARRRIETDPAGARKIRLAPRVQIGEVAIGARRPVERLHVGDELNQVTRHEAARDPEMPQNLHEQPTGVAARARAAASSVSSGVCTPGSSRIV